MIQACKDLGVAVTAYSPLGSPDRPWAKPGDEVLMENPKLIELAKKYEKTVAQVLLRYQVPSICCYFFKFKFYKFLCRLNEM